MTRRKIIHFASHRITTLQTFVNGSTDLVTIVAAGTIFGVIRLAQCPRVSSGDGGHSVRTSANVGLAGLFSSASGFVEMVPSCAIGAVVLPLGSTEGPIRAIGNSRHTMGACAFVGQTFLKSWPRIRRQMIAIIAFLTVRCAIDFTDGSAFSTFFCSNRGSSRRANAFFMSAAVVAIGIDHTHLRAAVCIFSKCRIEFRARFRVPVRFRIYGPAHAHETVSRVGAFHQVLAGSRMITTTFNSALSNRALLARRTLTLAVKRR
jgi:hypothetical protein